MDFVPSAYQQIVQTRAQYLAGGVSTNSLDQRLLCADGTEIDVSISGTPFVLPEGQTGALIVVRDITVQKKAEQLVRESEERFRTMVESAFQLVLLVSPDGLVKYISKSAQTLLGYHPDEVVGLDFFAFIHPDDLPDLVKRFVRLAGEPGRHRESALRVRDRSGSWRSFETSAVNLVDQPAVAAIVVHARDVSDQLELASNLERLRRIDTLGRVAANVAHEFNNVLMGISPYAEVLRRRTGGDSQMEQAVSAVSGAVARGKRLVEQIRQFGKGINIQKEQINVRLWLDGLEPTLQQLVPPGVRMTLCVEGVPKLSADPHLLSQALINLIVNARDAMPSGGSITITMRALPSCGSVSYLDLEVADTGGGISHQERERIFEPFFTTKTTGTGLGLAVVQQIMAAHGGRVMVESTVGLGTRVSLLIPM